MRAGRFAFPHQDKPTQPRHLRAAATRPPRHGSWPAGRLRSADPLGPPAFEISQRKDIPMNNLLIPAAPTDPPPVGETAGTADLLVVSAGLCLRSISAPGQG
jgi:hypothetical protein